MLNALKKLVRTDNAGGSATASGAGGLGASGDRCSQPLAIDRNLQKMFAKGVHYNMKIVIKGDRNVGKTCLWRRLQGAKYESEYTPTEEIQVCHIQWSYKATDDIVKVEIWDVVDKARKRRPLGGLKLNGGLPAPEIADMNTALDAEFIDVYKGTNGVIMVLDMTKAWTFEYVQRELPKVPEHIPVLVLANHLDMRHHRVVSADQVKFFVEDLERTGAPIRYAESSMSNGFGLRFLHKFFNVPFLQLQRETLLGQLERNRQEMAATCEELDLLLESDESNYELFVDRLGQRRRQVADSCANIAMVPGAAPGKITGGGVLPAKLPKSMSLPAEITNTILNKGSTPAAVASSRREPQPPTPPSAAPATRAADADPRHRSTDDYVREAMSGGDLNKFLEDADDDRPSKEATPESESDDDTEGNPLVCGFQDDLDPEDLVPPTRPSTVAPQPVATAAVVAAAAAASATGSDVIATTAISEGEEEEEEEQEKEARAKSSTSSIAVSKRSSTATTTTTTTKTTNNNGADERLASASDNDVLQGAPQVSAALGVSALTETTKSDYSTLPPSAVEVAAIHEDTGSHTSSVKDEFSPELRLEREEPDGTSSPAEWQPHDLDQLEKQAFERLSSGDEAPTAEAKVSIEGVMKERRKHRKSSSKKPKKDKLLSPSSDKERVEENASVGSGSEDKATKKKKKSKKNKRDSTSPALVGGGRKLIGEDPLEAFLNDRSHYETL